MKRCLTMLIALLCTLTMAWPAMTYADETNSEGNTGAEYQARIEFGSYPQTEIVGKASQSGAYGRKWVAKSDYEVNSGLYAKLKKASYDANGDTTVDGVKYRRIKKSDATYTENDSYYYKWSDSKTYHYFRYDPIVWRVLSNNGNDMFLLSETALDNQQYDPTETTDDSYITWEDSSLRSWLNDSFINSAFTAEEQSAIRTTEVTNSTIIQRWDEVTDDYIDETVYENNTRNKIFLLSQSEVSGAEGAAYGFAEDMDADDKSRRTKGSGYAKAMGLGACDGYAGISLPQCLGACDWWLRTSSHSVWFEGALDVCSTDGHSGVRPAMHLSLTAFDIESHNAKPSQTEFVYSGAKNMPTVTIEGLTEGEDFAVEYSGNVNIGRAKVRITGTGDYSGTITRYFRILPKGTYLRSLSKSKKAFTAKWKKRSTETSGYQLRYSVNSDMSSAKTKTMSKNSYTSKKVTGLKYKTRYYVQIRTYKKVGNEKFYSGWSDIKTVTTK